MCDPMIVIGQYNCNFGLSEGPKIITFRKPEFDTQGLFCQRHRFSVWFVLTVKNKYMLSTSYYNNDFNIAARMVHAFKSFIFIPDYNTEKKTFTDLQIIPIIKQLN